MNKTSRKKQTTRSGSAPGGQKSRNQTKVIDILTQRVWHLVGTLSILLIALYPGHFLNLIDSWIGFSEQWQGSQHVWQSPKYPQGITFVSDVQKQQAVVNAFKHAWNAYKRDAWGDDQYHPISRQGSNLTMAGSIGYTIIDAIDTLQLMGLDNECRIARQWIKDNLSFNHDDYYSTFEVTIRVLGGLLSAHHLSSNDSVFLEKAVELADRLLPAFDSPSGLPYPLINLARKSGAEDPDNGGLVSIAEVATLQLEFRHLSQLTGNPVYWKRVEKVMDVVKRARLPHGLPSIHMSIETGLFVPSTIRLGSRSDSYFEYLLKQYIQTNRTENMYRTMYHDAMNAVHEHLVRKSMGKKLVYTSEIVPQDGENGQMSWLLVPKQDHLVCFLGGTLMLGAIRTGNAVERVSVPPLPEELSDQGKRDWETGAELLRTCIETHDTKTGLPPEVVHFRIPSDGMDKIGTAPSDWYIKGAGIGKHPPYDAKYMLRPETIESLFIAFRLTGNVYYREKGWDIFQALEKHCLVSTGGFASILNVDQVPAVHEDLMESFFLSETLKYLYLLFSGPELLPLDKFVLNTEAHPLPIFDAPT